VASVNLPTRITYWQVAEEYSHSDHNYIEYTIKDIAPNPHKKHTRRRNIKSINQKKLVKIIIEKTSDIDIGNTSDDSAKALSRILTEVLDEVAPKKIVATKRKTMYWWTQEIKQLRATSNQLRRVYTRKWKRSGMDQCTAEKENFKKAKLEFTKAIKKFKGNAWRELCQIVESDPWGRLVTGNYAREYLVLYRA